MRVLIVNSLYAPYRAGGAEASVQELAEGLVSLGVKVAVATLGTRGDPYFSIHNGVEVFRWTHGPINGFISERSADRSKLTKLVWHARENFRPRGFRFLRSVVRVFGPDLINLHNIAGFGLVSWAISTSLPTVQTIRDYYLVCANSRTYKSGSNCVARCPSCSFTRGAFALAQRRNRAVIAISGSLLARVRGFGLGDVLPGVVVANQPRAGAHDVGPRPPDGDLCFGFVGHIAEYKGIWKLIEAFSQVDNPDIRLHVAGRTASAADSVRMHRLTSEDSRIVYRGQVDALNFWSNVDVVMVPSQWHEPLGRVVQEARAFGRAVWASDIGGLTEVSHDDEGVHLVKNWGTSMGWRDVIIEAIAGPHFVEPPSRSPTIAVESQYVSLFQCLLATKALPAN